MKALVIGGTQSGSGKTSVALGLAAAYKKRGLVVQAYKVGPDFLDPTYLEIVTGRQCYNLDMWMTGEVYVKELFLRVACAGDGCAEADVCIIEGVMGLYDGIFTGSDYGSTAAVAKLLGVPVFLLSSCKAMARSFAALISGFCGFEGAPDFAAVGANMAGSKRHGGIIKDAVDSMGYLPDFAGALVRGGVPELNSRHLGLLSANSSILSEEVIDELACGVEDAFDLDLLLDNARNFDLSCRGAVTGDRMGVNSSIRIGVAMDEAFHFYYPDNLVALADAGCEIIEFSPLADSEIPQHLDALYFGGGYPECWAEELAGNKSMLQSIRNFAGSGRVIYAECGGLMYMSAGICTLKGREYDMCGVFPVRVRMLERFKTLGYVEAEFVADNIFGEKGRKLRGHEYHYSEIVDDLPEDWQSQYALRFGRDMQGEIRQEGYAKDGVLISYLHANFAANPEALHNMFASIDRRSKN